MRLRMQSALIAAVALACAAGAGSQPAEWPKRQLQFVAASATTQPWPSRAASPDTIVPKYAAVFTVKWLGVGFSLDPRALKDIAKRWTSATQQAFVVQNEARTPNLVHISRTGRPQDPDYRSCVLYAVSEEDARKMAQGYIAHMDDKGRERLETLRSGLEVNRRTLTMIETALPKLRAEREKDSQDLATLQTGSYYQTVDEARKLVAEFNSVIALADIDIAGIKAKLAALKQAREDIRRQLEPALDVDLVGVVARKKAAEDARARAADFVRLSDRIRETDRTLAEYTIEVPGLQRDIERDGQILSDPPPEMRPAVVIDNKVTIYRLAPGATPPATSVAP